MGAMPLEFFRNAFAGNPLDRSSYRRSEPDWIAARLADAETRAIVLWNGDPLVETAQEGRRLARLPMELVRPLAGDERRLLFLGMDGERALFAADLGGEADPAEGALKGFGHFLGLRDLVAQLTPEEAGMAATAKAMFDWSRRRGFCSVCGQENEVVDAGWRRRCPVCGADHFPRTDPVVIMLPTFGEKCLLGRLQTQAPGRFSCLAGFLEPGESIEEACAREVMEESGLEVTRVRYHSSQPWPWPSNLMIGLIAEVSGDQAAPDQTELAEVHWFTREEARALVEDELEGFKASPPLAVGHQLLRAWAYGG
jgi:NAD+ diphosphatase